MERSFYFDERILIREITPGSPVDLTGNCEIPLDDFSRRQKRVEADLTGMDCSRSRCTADGNPPIHTIQPLISERNSVLGCDGLQASASPGSHLPADFEEVGEIPIHGEGEPDRNGKEAVVVHAQALEAAALPQEPSPRQMQRSARDLSLSLIGHV